MTQSHEHSPQGRVVAALSALALSLIGVAGAALPATAADTPLFGDINQNATGSIVIHKGVQKGGTLPGTASGTAPTGFEGLAGVQFTAYRITSVDPTKESGWKTLNSWVATPPASIADGTACNTSPPTLPLPATVSTSGTTSGTTDGNGLATIPNLVVGAYVVCETLSPNNVVDKAQPFIISVPYPDTTTGGWLYNPSVYPKNGIAAITKAATGQSLTNLGLGSPTSFTVTTTVPVIASGTQFSHFWIQDPLDPVLTGGTATVTASGLDSNMYTVEQASTTNGNTVTVAFKVGGLEWLKSHAGTTITTTVTGTASDVGAINNKAYLDSATATGTVAQIPPAPNTTPGHDNPGNANNPLNLPNTSSPRTASNPVTTKWGTLKARKVDSRSPATGLSGAVFEVYPAQTPYPANASACTPDIATNGAAIAVGTVPSRPTTFTSTGGLVTVPGLFVSDSATNSGSTFRCYVLKEISAPLGYITPTGANALTAVAALIVPLATGSEPAIVNTQISGVVLPMTGSNGIVALTVAGLALISVGLLLAFLARRRKQTA